MVPVWRHNAVPGSRRRQDYFAALRKILLLPRRDASRLAGHESTEELATDCVGGPLERPAALWFDFTSSFEYPELRMQCSRYFNIAYTARMVDAERDIRRLAPRVLCFDFDAPDQKRLGEMREIKRAHSKLPILMFTREHSEALAVWAFRARVWNYFVKPVLENELEENLASLARIVGASMPARAPHLPVASIPEELPEKPNIPVFARLQPSLRFVEEHFAGRIQAEHVARLCGLTRFAFSRAFRSAFGLTFRDYVVRFRIGEACKLLKDGTRSITDVTYAVGFNDSSYFARMFRRYAGVLPSDYQGGAHPLSSMAQALRVSAPAPDGPEAEDMDRVLGVGT
jgi:AraC-like DNA-binding protein